MHLCDQDFYKYFEILEVELLRFHTRIPVWIPETGFMKTCTDTLCNILRDKAQGNHDSM